MVRFIVEFVLFSALLLAATVPVTLVTKQRRLKRSPRRWHKAAVAVGFVAAVLGWSSRDLIQKCEDARYNECIDIGSAGMQVLFLGGFSAWALLSAYLLYRE